MLKRVESPKKANKRSLGREEQTGWVWEGVESTMEFSTLDRIVAWVPGRWIRAEKWLRESEPYLPDHFPGTPVLPGVLILEGMAQAGRWLLHFSQPSHRRRYRIEAFRGVKFLRFVQPGEKLEIHSQLVDFRNPDGPVEMLCQGEVGGRTAVLARIWLCPSHGDSPSEELPPGKLTEVSPFALSGQRTLDSSEQNGPSRSEAFRWVWIDRFTQFQSGAWAEACKQAPSNRKKSPLGWITADRLSAPFILEGMAQTGGLLAFEATGFQLAPIMARIPEAEFYLEVEDGQMLTYRAQLERLGPEGAAVSVTSHQADQLQAKAQILFALVGNGSEIQPKVDPTVFYRMMNELAAFEVPTPGRPIPPAAEQRLPSFPSSVP